MINHISSPAWAWVGGSGPLWLGMVGWHLVAGRKTLLPCCPSLWILLPPRGPGSAFPSFSRSISCKVSGLLLKACPCACWQLRRLHPKPPGKFSESVSHSSLAAFVRVNLQRNTFEGRVQLLCGRIPVDIGSKAVQGSKLQQRLDKGSFDDLANRGRHGGQVSGDVCR